MGTLLTPPAPGCPTLPKALPPPPPPPPQPARLGRYLGANGHALGGKQGADKGCFVGAVALLSLQVGLRVALLQLERAEVTESTRG